VGALAQLGDVRAAGEGLPTGPETTTHFTASSTAQASSWACSAWIISTLIALRTSGRLSSRCPTPSGRIVALTTVTYSPASYCPASSVQSIG